MLFNPVANTFLKFELSNSGNFKIICRILVISYMPNSLQKREPSHFLTKKPKTPQDQDFYEKGLLMGLLKKIFLELYLIFSVCIQRW